MRSALVAVCVLGAAGCLPEFDDRPWLVDDTRVLAVRGAPAEQRPNMPVSFEALVVSTSGTAASNVDWSYCTRPRSVQERTGVTASCLAGDDLVDIDATTTVLSDACARFGPNPPPSDGEDGARRPADPDPTGGYYLPVRARVGVGDDEVVAFGFQRIRCDLAGATRAIFDEFEERYTLNQAPAIETTTLVEGSSEIDLASGPVAVSAGATVELRVTPTAGAAEPYVVYSAEDAALFDRGESLTVSWYVTDGQLERAHQTRSRDALTGQPTLSNTWRLPDAATTAHGWIVLRDIRGGVTWSAFRVDLQ